MLQQVIVNTIEADGKTRCGTSLEALRNATSLRKNLRDGDGNSYIIQDWGNWILSLKAGPYSDKDCMVIYGGDDEKVKGLTGCTNKERLNLRKILLELTKGIEEHYYDRLNSGELEMIIGINVSRHPGPKQVQSVFRPHIHISLFHTKSSIDNNVETKIEPIEEYLPKLGLTEENKVLLETFEKYFAKHIKKHGGIPAFFFDETHHALDFELPNSEETLGRENALTVYDIYSRVEEFIHGVALSLDIDWGMMVDYHGPVFDTNNLAYSLAISKQDGKNNLRLKFMYKNGTSSGGVVECMGIVVDRILKDSPRLPVRDEFRKVLLGIVD